MEAIAILKMRLDALEQNYAASLIADASASHAGQPALEASFLVARKFIVLGQVVSRSDIPPSLPKAGLDG